MKLGVVVPAYASPDDLRDCLASVVASRLPDGWALEVVVVDNASDERVAAEAERYPVRLLRPGRNLGISGGRNAGMAELLHCDAVVFVDHDVTLEAGCLALLVRTFSAEPDVGVVTPRIFYRDAPERTWAAGTLIDLRTGRVRFVTEPPSADPYEVDVAPSVIMASRRALTATGGFDEDFFAVWEDTDFCVRARKAGLGIMCVPAATALHRTPVTAADQIRHLASRAYWVGRNRVLFMRRHGTRPLGFVAMLPVYAAYYALVCFRAGKPRQVISFLRGTTHGLLNPTPPGDARASAREPNASPAGEERMRPSRRAITGLIGLAGITATAWAVGGVQSALLASVAAGCLYLYREPILPVWIALASLAVTAVFSAMGRHRAADAMAASALAFMILGITLLAAPRSWRSRRHARPERASAGASRTQGSNWPDA